MTPIEKDKLEVLCKKWNLSELKISKGVYMADDKSGITMNLRGDVPLLGVTIAGTFQTEGHGLLKVADIQTEMNQIMKSKTVPTSKSPVTDLSAPPKAEAKGSNPVSGGIDKGTQSRQMSEPTKPIPSETKLGAGDTPVKTGTTTAICQVCKCTITGTIDIFQKIQDEYGVIYCQKCGEDAKRFVRKLKEELDERREFRKSFEKQWDKPEPKPEPKMPVKTCKSCGLELSGARALECYQNDKAFICEECEEKQNEPKVKEKIMYETLPIPVNKQEAKLPVKKTDAQIDEMIELAKAEKFLKGQGGSYTVSGKNRPDSAMVQKIANAENISCEILVAEQTKDYAHVVVRGHQGTNYVDAVVHHDFETEFQLQTMEIIKKNPHILDHYEGLIPVIKEGATIVLSDKQVDAKYHLIHTLLSFKTFSLRDASTKAMQIVQSKLLNQDPRTKEEVASEQKERDLVEEKRNQKR